MKGKLLLAGVPAQDRLHEYFSLFGDNGKVYTPEGILLLLFLEIPSLRFPIQPLLMQEESHGLESVTPIKEESAEMERAELHLKLYQANMGSYFGSSKHNYFCRQKNYFS